MSSAVLPPTPEIEELCSVIDSVVGRFIAFRREFPASGEWEAVDDAWAVSNLLLRNCEALCCIALRDLALLPAGWCCGRAAAEHAGVISWLLAPVGPYEREARWIARLREYERYVARTTTKRADLGLDVEPALAAKQGIVDFVSAVEQLLPDGTAVVTGVPSPEIMLTAAGEHLLAGLYISASQYVHGTYPATQLFVKNLGTAKSFGQYIGAASWREPFFMVWRSLLLGGTKYLETVGMKEPMLATIQEIAKVEWAFTSLALRAD